MFNTPLPTVNELPSTRKLVRSTVIALLTAVGLLVTVVMPSEYAVDPTGVGRALGLTQMGELKIILAQEALADAAPAQPAAPAPQVAQFQPTAKPAAQPVATPDPALKTDQMTVTLKPGEGTEIKLEMLKNKTVSYEWTAAGGPVNYDTHASPTTVKRVTSTATPRASKSKVTKVNSPPFLTAPTVGFGVIAATTT